MAHAYGPDRSVNSWQSTASGHLAGRLISAFAGAATAWIVFSILFGRISLLGAAAGGLAMAMAPGHVMHSRFQTVDVLATMFLVASLLFASRMVQSQNPLKCAIWAGVFAGLSAGTKYTGVLALLVLIPALWLLPRSLQLKTLLSASLACVFVFILTTPGCLLHSSKFLQDVGYEFTHSNEGHGLVFAGTSSGFFYHIGNLFAGMGPLVVVIGFAGLVASLWQRQHWVLGLGLWAFVDYVVIGRAEVKFFRYAIPLIPVLAVGFGWFIGWAHMQENRRWRGLVGLGALGLGLAISQALTFTIWMSGEDPRDAAGRKLIADASPTTEVGLVSDPWFYTPSVFQDAALPRSVPFAIRDQLMRAATQPRVGRYVPPEQERREDWDVRLITEKKPEFVVYSSFEIDDLERLERNHQGGGFEAQIAQVRTFFKALSSSYRLEHVYGFGGPAIHDLMYIRPRLWVWKRIAN